MSSPKEIAEYILKDGIITTNAEDVYSLARSYLELEAGLNERGLITKFWIENNIIKQEITKLKEENDKLKKSREVLRTACEFYSLMIDHKESAQWFMQMDMDRGHTAREALKNDDEIMKGE